MFISWRTAPNQAARSRQTSSINFRFAGMRLLRRRRLPVADMPNGMAISSSQFTQKKRRMAMLV
jgi:hypothetical protein